MRAFSQIDFRGAPPSAELEIIKMMNKGEITFDQYLDMTAIHGSDYMHTYQPKQYPPIMSSLLEYAAKRNTGVAPKNDSDSKALNVWIKQVLSAQRDEESDIETITWIKSRCSNNKLTGQVEKCEQAEARYTKSRFPHEAFEVVYKAYTVDMEERKHEAWGRKIG